MVSYLTTRCRQCGKEFSYPFSERHERKYCSQACAHAALRRPNSIKRKTVPCGTCGKPVTYYPSAKPGYDHIYCCEACARIGSRTRFLIQCRWCGKPFEVTPTEYKNGRRLCSWNCRKAEKEDARQRICEVCGNPFRVKQPSYKTRTCSRKCSDELRKRGKIIHCEICGKEIWVMPCHFDTRRFCSCECKRVAQSREFRGENHPNWHGGISKLPYPFEWTDELKAQIRKRDGNKCAECGDLANLTVHHIDYDKSNCAHTNLITLCNSCNCRANFHRTRWQSRYTDMIDRIYAAQSKLSSNGCPQA